MSKTLIYAIVAAVVIAAGAWWYLAQPVIAPGSATGGVQEKVTSPADAGLGGQIYSQATPNPAAHVPETNPFKTQTNPYDTGYKNPFGQ